jgi:hypothetical protein
MKSRGHATGVSFANYGVILLSEFVYWEKKDSYNCPTILVLMMEKFWHTPWRLFSAHCHYLPFFLST